MSRRPQFYRHMPVFQVNGRRLGRTEEVGHASECIHVQQGRVLVRDWYVPIEAVREITPQGVYLFVSKGDLKRAGRTVPPEDFLSRLGATPGYEYTSPADIPSYGYGATEAGKLSE